MEGECPTSCIKREGGLSGGICPGEKCPDLARCRRLDRLSVINDAANTRPDDTLTTRKSAHEPGPDRTGPPRESGTPIRPHTTTGPTGVYITGDREPRLTEVSVGNDRTVGDDRCRDARSMD